jgi:hypothetical protein
MVVLSALMALGNVSIAVAAPPDVTIVSPANGSVINTPTPSFTGFGEQGVVLTLDVFRGAGAEGTIVQKSSTFVFVSGGEWSLGPLKPLEDGTYTALATQTNGETGSTTTTFTIDTAAPVVTLNAPESPSDDTTPSFTGSATDTTPVTVQIHAGASEEGTIVALATAAETGGNWRSTDAQPALPVGEYTAVATQDSSFLGNPAGRSAPVSFSVVPPLIAAPERALGPPTASFRWFPPAPQTDEPVSLVSSSSDAASPITALAWSLAGTDPFENGGTVLTTTFSTPGPHAVRLRVTNAAGLASVATETIDVVARATPLMQPFPVVRIAGSYYARGVRLRLLRVQQMPAGARVTVRCRGHGCPLKSASRLAVSNGHGVAQIEFKRFERWLPAGVSLEILVSKTGEIGKYTRFRARRARPPERVDMCLEAMGTKPLACPNS